MRVPSIAVAHFLSLLVCSSGVLADRYLQVTTIVTTPANVSALECWQFGKALQLSGTAGTSGVLNLALGSALDVRYYEIPARFKGGLHTAPAFQFVAFLTGQAYISLPGSSVDAKILGGSRNSLILAADTTGSGHFTEYPSDETTTALSIPLWDGIEGLRKLLGPIKVIKKGGPCVDREQVVEQRVMDEL